MERKKGWINAALLINENINAIVVCPNCYEGNLIIKDVAFDDKNIEKGGERYLICPNCKKNEAILYRVPPINWYAKSGELTNDIL